MLSVRTAQTHRTSPLHAESHPAAFRCAVRRRQARRWEMIDTHGRARWDTHLREVRRKQLLPDRAVLIEELEQWPADLVAHEQLRVLLQPDVLCASREVSRQCMRTAASDAVSERA